MNAAAALMAWFVLRPMRRAQMNESMATVQQLGPEEVKAASKM
jgi:hypothetical protein